MEHLNDAANLSKAGRFGIKVLKGRRRGNVSSTFPPCAEEFGGCDVLQVGGLLQGCMSTVSNSFQA